jgi:hypothetical protein
LRQNCLDFALSEAIGKAESDFSIPHGATVWDSIKQREIVLLTNHLEFGATTIYKQRWQIELFFKALKQLLRIKTFVGTTENALRIQIWTALIAILR